MTSEEFDTMFPGTSNPMRCKYHPEVELEIDDTQGDMVCPECGLVGMERVVDIANEYRSYSDVEKFTPESPFTVVGGKKRKLSNSSSVSNLTEKDLYPKKRKDLSSEENETKDEMISVQFLELNKHISPFEIQKELDNLLKRKVDIKGKGHRIHIKILSTAEREQLYSLAAIGKHRIKVFRKEMAQTEKIVIVGVPFSISEETLKEQTSCLSVFRITKRAAGKEKVQTTAVCLTFPKGKAPKEIRLAYLRFKTRPYISKPLRCFKCSQYGHKAQNCLNDTKCPICLKGHDYKSCPEKEMPKKEQTRACASCNNKNHRTGDKKCPKLVLSKSVNKLVSYEGMSYAEAVKRVKTSAKKPEEENQEKQMIQRKQVLQKKEDISKNTDEPSKAEQKEATPKDTNQKEAIQQKHPKNKGVLSEASVRGNERSAQKTKKEYETKKDMHKKEKVEKTEKVSELLNKVVALFKEQSGDGKSLVELLENIIRKLILETFKDEKMESNGKNHKLDADFVSTSEATMDISQ